MRKKEVRLRQISAFVHQGFDVLAPLQDIVHRLDNNSFHLESISLCKIILKSHLILEDTTSNYSNSLKTFTFQRAFYKNSPLRGPFRSS